MANQILTKKASYVESTLTLASLATTAYRQSALIDSSSYDAARIYFQIKSGASAPAAGGQYELYIAHFNATSSATFSQFGASGSDASFSNSITDDPILVHVVTNTANATYYGSTVVRGLGPAFSLIVRNNTNQSFSTTESDHVVGYCFLYPEVQ